jgi:hypothetical protein
VRSPNPAVLVCLGPIAVGFELFGAPNRFVKVLDVVFESLRKVLFAIADPGVDRIARRSGNEVPVAGVLAGDDQFRRTTFAQSETRRVGINPGGATVAYR